MKHEQYKTEFINLKENVITEIKHQLLNENAAEIQFHTGIIYNFIDEQQNEVIRRLNVETARVQIDTGNELFDEYWNELTELSLDILLAILEAVETGSYEVWEEFES